MIESHGCIFFFFLAGLKHASNTISEHRTISTSEYKEDISVQRPLSHYCSLKFNLIVFWFLRSCCRPMEQMNLVQCLKRLQMI
jgi:hypothetical protein